MSSFEREEQPGTPCSTCRILVVDDNADAADSLAVLLRLEGHEVRTAGTGQLALSLAREFRPQIALLDIGLPDISGYEVARSLRSQPWAEQLYLVAVTGYGRAADKVAAANAGFDSHLTKPVDVEAITTLALDTACGVD